MKIKEYAANVSEYTEVVDAPYNHTGGEEVLDERPMGFVKGGLQKLGAKVLPGSYGKQMKGQVQSGQKANQLYSDFHEFLGQTGYKSTDTALKAFLQQQGINVDVDSIVNSVAPAPAAPAAAPASGSPAPAAGKGFNVKLPQPGAPTPVAESIDSLNRILVLSGRAPKKIINENKNILNEEVALNRGALNKIFMQVAQQAARPSSGGSSAPAAGGSPSPAAGGSSSAGAPASTSPAPAAPAAGGGVVSKVAGAVKGAINKLTTPTAAPASTTPVEPPTSAPPVEPPAPVSAPAAGSSAPPVEPPAPVSAPAAPKASAPASKGSALAPASPGPLGGTKPGAAAAKAAGAQKQSTQNTNDYVKNISAQLAAAPSQQDKINIAKELINFMADRQGTPEYDNAISSAKAVLQKAGLKNMVGTLKGGQTATASPQGLGATAGPNALQQQQANKKAANIAKRKATDQAASDAAAPIRAAKQKQKKQAWIDREQDSVANPSSNESKILNRNSYIFLRDVLENSDLTLRDLGYRVSITESTSDSVLLISR
jgi:hypothetical protein